MITVSALPRLINCPSSAVLARAEAHSAWADLGNDAHEVLAAVSDPEHDFAHLIPAGARSEVKVAYDVVARTGRIIGEGSGRDYGSVGPFEIPGSIDVLGVVNGCVIVIDWKTGFADVDPASRNHQLWGYALAACRALGCDTAVVKIVYTQTGYVDEHAIDVFDLADFADRLERLHVQVAERQRLHAAGTILDTREGSWCKHCPSKAFCPSKVALLVQIADKGLAVIGDTAVTAERAAAAYDQIVRIESLVKDARKRLEVYVDEQGPIDLGNGKMYGRYERKGSERLDGAIAIRAIREVVGESAREFEAIAIEHSTSKAAIDRAAKQLVVSGSAKVAKAVIAKVRELGGSTTTRSTMPVGEYMRGKDEPAAKPTIDVAEVDRLLEAV
jgi:hypothetical protein